MAFVVIFEALEDVRRKQPEKNQWVNRMVLWDCQVRVTFKRMIRSAF